MTIYNTSADAANTTVRAFLTRVGKYYLGRSFNTGSGKAMDDLPLPVPTLSSCPPQEAPKELPRF